MSKMRFEMLMSWALHSENKRMPGFPCRAEGLSTSLPNEEDRRIPPDIESERPPLGLPRRNQDKSSLPIAISNRRMCSANHPSTSTSVLQGTSWVCPCPYYTPKPSQSERWLV